jgi:hypothetical protein
MTKSFRYHTTQKRHESPQFKNYCADGYAIELLDHFIHSKEYEHLNSTQQLNILQTYKQKLIFKNKMDKEVLHRTRENDSNQKRLQALRIKYLNFPKKTTVTDRKEIDDALAIHDDSKAKSDYDIKDLTTSINAHRSDTTWFRELLLSFINSSATQSDSFKKFLELNTYVGFSIYGIRGGWEIAKLVKHTFIDNNPFYQENQLGTLDRLSVQLQIRYPIIVNDVVWGLTNSLSYFLLKNNDPTAGWLVFIMSFVDLISMIKQTYDIQQNFKKLEDALGVVPKEIQEKHDLEMKSQYLSILIQLGMITSFIAVFTLLPGVAPVAGVIACFVMQVFSNVKDHLLQIYNSNDTNERWTIAFKMVLRVMLQAIIPAMFILCSLYLLPIIPSLTAFLLINAGLIVLTKLSIDFVSVCNENFKNYMMSDQKIDATRSENEQLKTDLHETERNIKSNEEEIKQLLNMQRCLNNELLSNLKTPNFINLCKTTQIAQNKLTVKINELKSSSASYQDKKGDLLYLIEHTQQSIQKIREQKGSSIDNIKNQLNLLICGASFISLLAMAIFSLGGAFIAIPAVLMLISASKVAYVKYTKSESKPEANPDQAPALLPPSSA